MKVTYFGTTTLLFDDGKDQILLDAHMTRPSLPAFLAGKHETDRKLVDQMLKLHRVDRLRAIFVSHSHYDHVFDAPYIASKTGAKIYGSASTLNVARGGDIEEDRLVEFCGNEIFEVGNYRIRVIPSIHSRPTAFNNDLGETIDQPLRQPARMKDYKEGGSFDFLMEAENRRFLIRPSFNYIEGQLDGIQADVLFLGIAGITKFDPEEKRIFFRETVEKVRPQLVIPVHWDNFFSPLAGPIQSMPRVLEQSEDALYELTKYCEAKNVSCILQMPRTFVRL